MSWIDTMTPEEYFRNLSRAVKDGMSDGSTSPGGPAAPRSVNDDVLTPAQRERFRKDIKNFTQDIKESTGSLESWKAALSGQEQQLVDITKTLKDLDKAIEETTDQHEKARMINERSALAWRAALKNVTATTMNFGVKMFGVAMQMVSAGIAFERGLLSGSDGISVATDAMVASLKAAGDTAKASGDALGSIGTILMLLPGPLGLLGRAIGAVIAFAAPLMGAAAQKAAELAAEGAKILGDELIKTRKTFEQITGAGVVFAGGMGEMRKSASDAGLKVQDFADLIKENTANLSSMGMSMSDAAKRIGGVSKVLRSGELGDQLQKLGYSFKEQAALASDVAVSLQAAGQLRGKSDAEVARLTNQYGKDLKVIQEMTGEDAKKKMEQARKEALAADIRTQLLKKDPTGESLRRFEKVFATVPDELKTGFLQSVASGGKAITDVATNVAMANQPAIGAYLKASTDLVNNAAVTAEESTDLAVNNLKIAGKAVKDSSAGFEQVAFAARMTGDSMLTAATGIVSKMTEAGIRMENASVEAERKRVDSAATTNEALTNSVVNLDKKMYQLSVQLEGRVTGALGTFADQLNATSTTFARAIDAINAALTKAGVEPVTQGKKLGGQVEAVGADVAKVGKMATIGGGIIAGLGFLASLTGIGAAAGIPMMAAGTSLMTGGAATFATGKGIETGGKVMQGKPAFNEGGIARGPKTGFDARLHGTEAVVPLPDNRSIPVQITKTANRDIVDIKKLAAEITKNSKENKAFQTDYTKDRRYQDMLSKEKDIILGRKLRTGTAQPGLEDRLSVKEVMEAEREAKLRFMQMYGQVNLEKTKLTSGNTSGREVGIKPTPLPTNLDQKISPTKQLSLSDVIDVFKGSDKPQLTKLSDESLKPLKDSFDLMLTKQDQIIAKLTESVDIESRILTHAQ